MDAKFTALPPLKPIKTTPKPPDDDDEGSNDDPSWGLIIPIVMIGVFLVCVALCLWWHKWRDRRRLRTAKNHVGSGTSFQRSYRGSRSRGSLYITRDSTRSTTPLRSSLNEKNNNFPLAKTPNVTVMPSQRNTQGKYSFYWDKNHWKAVPTPVMRPATKPTPLSPIDEIESPTSAKLSELSRSYDPVGPQSFCPYHLTWPSLTSTNAPPSYEESLSNSHRDRMLPSKVQSPLVHRPGNYSPAIVKNNVQEVARSPFFPNNNTPTTECDTESESSQYHRHENSKASQYTSYPSSPTSNTILSRSNFLPSGNTSSNQQGTSLGSSYPESSYQMSSKQSQSALHPSSLYTSRSTTATDQPSTNYSSLPSSIAPFSKQNLLGNDLNNNSLVIPNNNISFPRSKVLNYTLASSVSSDTHISDNTSMLPNVGSNNTSCYPGGLQLRSRQPSNEPSGPASPEDLSKLVDEMSSIRPVDESSSMRPNSSVDPTPRITTISGTSLLTGLHRSRSNAEMNSMNSTNSSSQPASQTDGSLYWDNYPLTADSRPVSKSYQELPLHVYENQSFLGHLVELSYHVPILSEEQYWV